MSGTAKLTLAAIVALLAAAPASAQPWMEGLTAGERNNFISIQSAFTRYWTGRDHTERSKGWKQFKRWEWFWSQRVDADGSFPDPMQLYRETRALGTRGARTHEGTGWVSLGPDASPGGYAGLGRLNCVRTDPGNPDLLWVGSASGGLWKSIDGGLSWTTATDELPTLGVTDIAIHPSNSSIMYIATGDGDAGDTYSVGVLKSTDGGQTWATTGLNWSTSQQRTISRLLLSPADPNILIAAGSGIYRSTDAGASWVLATAGVFRDMEFRPGNPAVLYASGNSNAVYRSTNAGISWQLSNTGISGAIGRIALAVTPADPGMVYALAANSSNSGFMGFFRSTDGGSTWSLRSTSPNLLGWSPTGDDGGGQGWYDLAAAASPVNANEVYTGGVNTWRSLDGGLTWTIVSMWYNTGTVPNIHADQHDLWFQPGSTTLFAANDGGVYRTDDAGGSWAWLGSGLPITQFYRLGTSATDSTRIIAGSQDNGTKGLSVGGWADVLGGDGMDCLIDYTNADIQYGSLYYGAFYRSTNGGVSFTPITESIGESGAWISPFAIHPSDPRTIFVGLSSVWKSTNRGDSWQRVGTAGGGTLDLLVIAPSDPNVIYIARANSFSRTTTGGASGWQALTLPGGATPRSIAVHPDDPHRIWATVSGYTAGRKVFESRDGGMTWTNISGILPNVPANTVVYQRFSPERLYVGTDIGVFTRDISTTDWVDFNAGLPNTVVTELEIHEATAKIRAATYGRGIWESPLVPDLGAVIGPSTSVLSFPTIEAGAAADTLSLRISAYGTDSLIVTGIGHTPGVFTLLDLPSFPVTIPARSGLDLRVTFAPVAHGAAEDSLEVHSNALNGPVTVVRLRGRGIVIGTAAPGVLYASSIQPSGHLYTLDPATGAATLTGPLGLSELHGLTVHPVTHELIGAVTVSSRTNLYRVSSLHGEALPIGSLPVGSIRALAYTPDGDTLYGGTTTGRLYRFDPLTGDADSIGAASGVAYASLSFEPDSRVLWGSVRPPTGARDRIFTVNTATGQATLVGATGDNAITPGIAFLPDGRLFGLKGTGVATNSLILISTITGAGTTVGSTGVTGLQTLAARSDSIVTSAGDSDDGLPRTVELAQNYPNPFNPATTVSFSLPAASRVRLHVTDMLGRRVAVLAEGVRTAGRHTAQWDGTVWNGLPAGSGVYFFTLEATPLDGSGAGAHLTRKMLLVR